MNTNQLGSLGESSFIHRFTQLGWKVFLPLGHDAAYDMVVDRKGELKRVQVKTTTSSDDTINVKIQRTHHAGGKNVTKNYTVEDFDWLGVYDARTEQCYIVPIEIAADRGALRLRLAPCRNGQVRGSYNAVDFLLTQHI